MTTCSASDTPGSPVNGNAAPKRPVNGKTWSEVCEQVQKPDGSVRTSPPFKSWQDVTNSPPRPRPFSYHLGKLGRTGPNERCSVGSGGRGSSRGSRGSSRGASSQEASSRGGSSRGSRGGSSRSSSRNGARDGDVSSQCSSGAVYWDTSTNSSVMSQEGDPEWPRENDMGDTQREEAVASLSTTPSPSPSGPKGLLMPAPILAGPLCALLAGEDRSGSKVPSASDDGMESPVPVAEVDGMSMPEIQMVTTYAGSQTDAGSQSEASVDVTSLAAIGPVAQLGLKLKRDPYGRDAPRNCEAKKEWSPEPLAKYLKGVVGQIDTNIQNHRLPTAEKLDAFVNRLVANTHRQLRHAPKKVRHSLNGLCARRFHRYWNFARNEKVRNTTPEELTSTLLCIVEALLSETVTRSTNQCQWVQPKVARWQPCMVDVSGSGG